MIIINDGCSLLLYELSMLYNSESLFIVLIVLLFLCYKLPCDKEWDVNGKIIIIGNIQLFVNLYLMFF